MTRASASHLQREARPSTEAGGERVASQRLTRSRPLTSDTQPVMTGDTAAFPREEKKKNNREDG